MTKAYECPRKGDPCKIINDVEFNRGFVIKAGAICVFVENDPYLPTVRIEGIEGQWVVAWDDLIMLIERKVNSSE